MRWKRLIAAVAILLLAGCNGVPLRTQWKLRHFDLGTADISQLRVALRVPEWATPTPDKTELEATQAQGDGVRKSIIHLRRALHAGDSVELAGLAPDPARLAVYEVAPPELATVKELQQQALLARQQGGEHKGGVKVGRNVACRNGATPDGPIPIDVYLHPDDDTGWLPLLEGFDLRPGLGSAEALRDFDASVPACDKTMVRAKLRAAQQDTRDAPRLAATPSVSQLPSAGPAR